VHGRRLGELPAVEHPTQLLPRTLVHLWMHLSQIEPRTVRHQNQSGQRDLK
jgi:hypothetical protein